jgi:hypothetical protein
MIAAVFTEWNTISISLSVDLTLHTSHRERYGTQLSDTSVYAVWCLPVL